MKSRIFFPLTLFVCASCQPQSHPSHPNTVAPPVAATMPVIEPSPPNSVDRLAAANPVLYHQWLNYRSKEGDAHRGSEFYNVAERLDRTHFRTASVGRLSVSLRSETPTVSVTQTEVFSFLGLPDCGFSGDGNKVCYVYSYRITNPQNRGEAFVEIHDGILESINWKDYSADDDSILSRYPKFKRYRKWSDLLGPAK